VSLLGRILKWRSWGVECQADPKHRRLIIEALGFNEKTKALTTNGERNEDEEDGDEEVGKEEATSFRAVAARMNFMAIDCPDLMFPVKELCREMSSPKVSSWKRLKKVARYMLGRRVLSWCYEWQEGIWKLKTYSDSDWAGCQQTRKSTSGGAIMFGKHLYKAWASTQGGLALSSAEAEYYAMVEAATRTLGIQSLMKELGVEADIFLYTDSSGAKSMASRRGLGKVRHIEVKWLWLQDAVAEGKVKLMKVAGEENVADLMTKYLPASRIFNLLSKMSVSVD
jgi:hypothetical protein